MPGRQISSLHQRVSIPIFVLQHAHLLMGMFFTDPRAVYRGRPSVNMQIRVSYTISYDPVCRQKGKHKKGAESIRISTDSFSVS